MTTYEGITSPNGNTVHVTRNGKTEHLGLYNTKVNHSPDGHNWGYGGSGPAQTAYAILCDHFLYEKNLPQPEALALANSLHHRFKTNCISLLPQQKGWTLDSEKVQQIVVLLCENPEQRERILDNTALEIYTDRLESAEESELIDDEKLDSEARQLAEKAVKAAGL